MGNYRIIIEGVGAHDNGKDAPSDAQAMADSFAGDLRRAGHTISLARFERTNVINGQTTVASHLDLITRKDSRVTPKPVRRPALLPEPRVVTGGDPLAQDLLDG